MTVSGLTMINADRQSTQAPDNHAQKTRSAMVNFGRFLAERRSTPIWCRSATISTWRAACERKTENIVETSRHRTLNIGLASQGFGKPNDLRKIEVSENHTRVGEESSRSRSSAACITVMNALPRNDMSADAFLANDRVLETDFSA
jgi:hypothetical protein